MLNRQYRAATRYCILGFLACVIAACAGCSLPGYQANPVKGDAWYDFGENHAEATYQQQLNKQTNVQYDARVIPITPAVIQYQQEQANKSHLSPAVQALIQPESNRAYHIGVGDVLKVIVYGQDGITNPTGSGGNDATNGEVVDSSGDIYFPYVGTVHVAGQTPGQVRKEIAHRISSYIKQPQVDVRVMQYRSKRVYVSGDIYKPCSVALTDVVNTVLQVLDECNTLSSGQSSSKSAAASGVQNVVLIRHGKSTLLDLNQIYATGNPIPVQAGDRLLIDDSANRVLMMGEFNHQQALPYSTGGMSLSDAIADAGGVDLNTADVSRIYVVRGFINSQTFVDGKLHTEVRPNVYKLDMDTVGGMLLANEFQLKPRDIVFAAPAGLVNFNRALSQITPSLNTLLQSLLLYDRFGSN